MGCPDALTFNLLEACGLLFMGLVGSVTCLCFENLLPEQFSPASCYWQTVAQKSHTVEINILKSQTVEVEINILK